MTPELKFTGTIKEVFETVQITEKFKKREFVITDNNESYPQIIKFELIQDNCNLLEGIQKGNEVEVYFNLKGKDFTKDGKTSYFVSLQAWKITNNSINSSAPDEQKEVWHTTTATLPNKSMAAARIEEAKNNIVECSDLPF